MRHDATGGELDGGLHELLRWIGSPRLARCSKCPQLDDSRAVDVQIPLQRWNPVSYMVAALPSRLRRHRVSVASFTRSGALASPVVLQMLPRSGYFQTASSRRQKGPRLDVRHPQYSATRLSTLTARDKCEVNHWNNHRLHTITAGPGIMRFTIAHHAGCASIGNPAAMKPPCVYIHESTRATVEHWVPQQVTAKSAVTPQVPPSSNTGGVGVASAAARLLMLRRHCCWSIRSCSRKWCTFLRCSIGTTRERARPWQSHHTGTHGVNCGCKPRWRSHAAPTYHQSGRAVTSDCTGSSRQADNRQTSSCLRQAHLGPPAKPTERYKHPHHRGTRIHEGHGPQRGDRPATSRG